MGSYVVEIPRVPQEGKRTMKKKIRWDKKKLLTALIVFVAWLLITVFIPDSPDTGQTTGAGQTETTTEGVTDEPTKPPAGESTQTPTQSPTEKPTPEPTEEPTAEPTEEPTEGVLDRDGTYTSKEDVALYLYLYGELPKNFITKSEAEKLGWEGGSVEKYAPGKSIGGDKFGNREGLLPKKNGRQYYECDIDTLGKNSRGAKRIVFSNDGLIYYTDDHYETFELLYTKDGPQ